MSDKPAADLADRARTTRVVVIGGGIAGLVAAWECARIGMPVTLLEQAPRLGGRIETDELDGITVDLAPEAFSLSAPALAGLLDELGLRAEVEPARDGSVGVALATPGGPRVVTLPPNRAGIPANVWAEPVRRLIGGRGVWRAYLDRLRPPLTIGRERSLGALVRSRMGAHVRDRLVAPLTLGTWAVDPDRIDVDLAVPGLSAALTRAGSLAGAVGQLLPDDDAEARRPRRARLRGGLTQLVTALTERLLLLDADLRVNARADSLTQTPDGWLVHLAPADPAEPTGPAEPTDPAAAGEPAPPLPADIVVLAAGAATSAALVRDHGIVLEAAPLPVRDVVTLVMDAGTAASDGPATIYPVPGAMAAASVIDVGSAWAGVRAHAGPGRRVLRLTFDAAPADDATDLIARAAADAAQLWPGIGGVRAAAQRRATLAPPASVLGHDQRTAATRAAIGRRHGLIAVGEDLAGGGVSAIVADTLAEVERVRHDALWTRS